MRLQFICEYPRDCTTQSHVTTVTQSNVESRDKRDSDGESHASIFYCSTTKISDTIKCLLMLRAFTHSEEEISEEILLVQFYCWSTIRIRAMKSSWALFSAWCFLPTAMVECWRKSAAKTNMFRLLPYNLKRNPRNDFLNRGWHVLVRSIPNCAWCKVRWRVFEADTTSRTNKERDNERETHTHTRTHWKIAGPRGLPPLTCILITLLLVPPFDSVDNQGQQKEFTTVQSHMHDIFMCMTSHIHMTCLTHSYGSTESLRWNTLLYLTWRVHAQTFCFSSFCPIFSTLKGHFWRTNSWNCRASELDWNYLIFCKMSDF